MIAFPAGTKVWIAGGVTDMRCGMNSLALKIQEGLLRVQSADRALNVADLFRLGSQISQIILIMHMQLLFQHLAFRHAVELQSVMIFQQAQSKIQSIIIIKLTGTRQWRRYMDLKEWVISDSL